MIEPRPRDEGGGWLRRLTPYFSAHRRMVVVALGGAWVGQTVNAFVPLIQKVIVDDVIVGGSRPLLPWIVLLLAAGLVSFVATYVRRLRGGSFGLAVQHDLRNAVYRHLQRLDFAQHDQLNRGDLISRATADVTLVQTLLSQLHVLLGNLTLVLTSVVLMVFLSPPLALVVALCLPALLLVAARMRRLLFPSVWNDQRCQAAVATVVEESTTGVRLVRAFAQEDRELERFVDRSRTLFASRMRTARLTARSSPTLQLIPALGQLGVLLVGGWMAMRGSISVGTFLAFMAYMVQLASPVRMLSGALTTAQQARAGAHRVLELLDETPLVVEREGAVPLDVGAGRIELRGVSFGYGPGTPLLDGLDLTVEAGERVAIVGESGSGKSTLALLLPRFYDIRSGTIRIDGVDIHDVTLASLRRAVGVVFEESFLHADTIRVNIAYGNPDATDAQIEAAARASGAHDFVVDLPAGYDAVVGELGLTLSGGQRQRIALARALLSDPSILVLDDATSAIDAETEEAIHTNLEVAMAGRTTLLIAHRLSTVKLADRVVVLDHGVVVADGTHDELLTTSPRYRSLLLGDIPEAAADDDAEPREVDATAWPERADTPGGPVSVTFREPVVATTARAMTGNPAALAQVTDEVLVAVAALPPATDEPGVDAEREATDTGSFSFASFARPYRGALLVGASLVVIDTATTLAGPLLVKAGVDRGVVEGSGTALLAASLAFLAVQLVSWGNAYCLARQTARTAERMLFALRVRMFAHLQRLSLDFYEREQTGRVMTRVNNDVEALSQLLQQGLVTAIASIVSSVGVLAVLVVLDGRLALAVLAIVPILVLATETFRRASARAYDRSRERVALVYSNLQEGLAGARVTQAYVREHRDAERFRDVSAAYTAARVTSTHLAALYFPFLQLLSILAKASVLVVASQLGTGEVSTGVLIAFLLFLDQFFAPIQQLSQVFDQWLQAATATRHIDELLRTEPTVTAPPHPLPIAGGAGEITFEHLRFRYPGAAADSLTDVDVTVPAGQHVALVGPTGAGKSTVVKLVARFYDPQAGAVRADGQALTDLDPRQHRRRLGYVPQEPFLFSGTVAGNIAYGRPEATRAEIEHAARSVGAHDVIRALPDGYLTDIGERGRSLSAGHRQLVCLARAALVEPQVLLLDEATANLDLASEARVQAAMDRLAADRTTFVVAHRLHTARRAERILVVDRGTVAEDGTHDELIARGGHYARLWATSGPAIDPLDDVIEILDPHPHPHKEQI